MGHGRRGRRPPKSVPGAKTCWRAGCLFPVKPLAGLRALERTHTCRDGATAYSPWESQPRAVPTMRLLNAITCKGRVHTMCDAPSKEVFGSDQSGRNRDLKIHSVVLKHAVKLGKGLILDLTNPFTGPPDDPADLLQSVPAFSIQPKP